MSRLFDHDVAAPARPAQKDRARRKEEELQLAAGAPQAIWSFLLDHGVDPVKMAGLLRGNLSPSERRRAFLELVRDLGAPLAEEVWQHAYDPYLQRAPFPVAARELAETAAGTPLVGIHAVTGELVQLVAAKMGTPAFTIGSEVFISGEVLSGQGHAVLVHEAIHAAQQKGQNGNTVAAPEKGAEEDAHRILRRIGPVGKSSALERDRARAQVAVRAALGRAPKVSARPTAVAAYEPTPESEQYEAVVKEGRKLAAALVALLERDASASQLGEVMGPLGDEYAERVRKIALTELRTLKLGDGREAPAVLAEKLGATSPLLASKKTKRVPEGLRRKMESRLGVSLGDVKLHVDEEAKEKTAAVDANAFTQGKDVYVDPAKFDPASKQGEALLAHELVHVAQQSQSAPQKSNSDNGHGENGHAQTAAGQVTAPSSPVENEARRIAHDVTTGAAGGEVGVRENLATGAIARDTAGAGSGGAAEGPTGDFRWNLLRQALQASLTDGAQPIGGTKKRLRLNTANVGPLRMDDLTIEYSGTEVQRGELRVSLIDGAFGGTSATLRVTKEGAVSGEIDVNINVPGAFVKRFRVTYSDEGLTAEIPITQNDFQLRDFPLTASDIKITLGMGGGEGLRGTISGRATARLDSSFASGTGTLTGEGQIGGGAPSFRGTLDANVNVAGLAQTQARIITDGRSLTWEAGAQIPINLPGVSGTAQVTWRDNKLTAEIPDLAFSGQLAPLRFKEVKLEDGKLKAAVDITAPVSLHVGGLCATFKPGSDLRVDGMRFQGNLNGSLDFGEAISGDFNFAFNNEDVSGAVSNITARIPGITVGGLNVNVRSLFKSVDVEVGGNLTINLGGVVNGQWNNLRWESNTLTGDVRVGFTIPRVTLPELSFRVGPGWTITGTVPNLTGSIDFGSGLGQLSNLQLSVAVRPNTPIQQIASAIGDISVRGQNITVPSLGSIATIQTLEVTIPGSGGQYNWGAANGSAQVSLNLGTQQSQITMRYQGGQFTVDANVHIDIARITPALTGRLNVQYQGGQFSFQAQDVRASNPLLRDKLILENAQFQGGRFSGTVRFASGPLQTPVGNFEVANSSITFDGERFSGQAQLRSGTGSVLTATLTPEGQFTVEGDVETTVQLSTIHSSLSGVMRARGSVGGGGAALQEFDVENARFNKEPWSALTINSARYQRGGAFEATVSINQSQLRIPGVTVTQLAATATIKGRQGGPIEFDGSIDGQVQVGTGSRPIASGSLGLRYANGSMAGSFMQIDQANVTVPGAAVSLQDFRLNVGDGYRITPAGTPKIQVRFGTFADINATVQLSDGRISGVTASATVNDTPITSQATLNDIQWDAASGKFSGSGAITLKDLGGLIQAGARIEASYQNDTWAARGNVTVSSGLFQGWNVGAEYQGGQFSVKLRAGGNPWTLGPAQLTVQSGTELTYVQGAGVSGNVSAQVAVLGQTVSGTVVLQNSQITDVQATANINIKNIIPVLMGNLVITYQRAGNVFRIEGRDIKVDVDGLRDKIAVRNVVYENQRITGVVDFSTGNLQFGPLRGSASGTMNINGTEISGTAHVAAAAGDVASVAGDIQYQGGRFAVTGGTATFNLGPATGGFMTGTLTASTGTAGNSFTGNAQFATEPLKTLIPSIRVTYDRDSGNLSATVQVGAAALNGILPSIVRVSGGATINVNRAATGAPFQVTADGNVGVTIGSYFNGNIAFGLDAQRKITGRLTVPEGGIQLRPPGVGITGQMVVAMDGDRKFTLESGKFNFNVMNGLLVADVEPLIASGAINGVKVSGTVGTTPFTRPGSRFEFTYQGGNWAGSGEMNIATFGGLLTGDPKLQLSVGSGGRFSGSLPNPISFASGPLRGFSLTGGEINDDDAWVEIGGGRPITIGPVTATIDGGSKIKFSKNSGISGHVDANIAIPALPAITDLRARVEIDGADIKVTVDTNIALSQISDKLTGNVNVKYQRDGGNKFTFKATNPGVNIPQAPSVGQILQEVNAQYDGSFSGDITIRPNTSVTITEGVTVTIVSGQLSLNNAKQLNGEIVCRAGVAAVGAGAEVKLKWTNGEFSWEGSVSIQLRQITNNVMDGELRAAREGGTNTFSGNGTFVNPPMSEVVTGAEFTYNQTTKHLSASVGVTAAALQRLMPSGVTVTGTGRVNVTKAGESAPLHIAATGSLGVSIADKLTGTLDIGFETGAGVNATLTINRAAITLPNTTISANAVIKYQHGEGVRLESGQVQFQGRYGGVNVDGTLNPKIEGNSISGAELDVNVGDTPFTRPSNVKMRYQNSRFSGEAKVKLATFNGMLGNDAELTVAVDESGGFSAQGSGFQFLKAPFNGFTVSDAKFSAAQKYVQIDINRSFTAAGATLNVAGGSFIKLKYPAPYVEGHVSGNVQFGTVGPINYDATISPEGETTVTANAGLGDLTNNMMTGRARATYTTVGGGREFSIVVTGPGFTAEQLRPYNVISEVTANYRQGEGFSGSISLAGQIRFAGNTLNIVPSTVRIGPDKKLDGMVRLNGASAGGGVTGEAEFGWRNGQFTWSVGGTFELGTLTDHKLEGQVRAEGGTGIGARLQAITPISAPALPGVTITNLTGQSEPPQFRFRVSAQQLLNNLASKLGGVVTVTFNSAYAEVDYNAGDLNINGEVTGRAAINMGGQPAVACDFKLAYDPTHKFVGELTNFTFRIPTTGTPYITGGQNIRVDLKEGTAAGGIQFNLPNVAEGPINFNIALRERRFNISGDANFTPSLLAGLQLHVEAGTDTAFLARLRVTADRNIDLSDVAKLTIKAGSQAEYTNGRFTATLNTTYRLGTATSPVAHGDINLNYASGAAGGFTGNGTVTPDDIGPLIADGTLRVDYADGKFNANGRCGYTLSGEYSSTFAGASVHLELHDNEPTIEGAIPQINNMGKFSRCWAEGGGATVRWNRREGISATATISLNPFEVFRDNSTCNVSYNRAEGFKAWAELGLRDFGSVHMLTPNSIELGWNKVDSFYVRGAVKADVAQLAEIELRVRAGGAEGGFELSGRIEATGLRNRWESLQFSRVPEAEFFLRVGNGTTDYGIPHVGMTISSVMGMQCSIALDGSYVKDQGVSATIRVTDFKVSDKVTLNGTGQMTNNNLDFVEVQAKAEFGPADVIGTARLTGSGGSLKNANFHADCQVIPKGELASLIVSGEVHVDLEAWKLKEAGGSITFKPPDFLEDWDNIVAGVRYDGATQGVEAFLSTGFKSPLSKTGERGRLTLRTSTTRGALNIEVSFPLTLPGFNTATIGGSIGYPPISVGLFGNFRPQSSFIKEANLKIEYAQGIVVEAWVVISPSDGVDVKVGVKYDKTGGFQILGMEGLAPPGRPDAGPSSAEGFEHTFPRIPLLTVGVAQLALMFQMGLTGGLNKPKFDFNKDSVKIGGGGDPLAALGTGGIPDIDFSGGISVGAYISFYFNVQIVGEIQLLIATARAGIGAELTARLDLTLGAAISGTFRSGQGAIINIDPYVGATLSLVAALIATLYAKVLFWTLVDKKYNLASFTLCTIDLGQFKPFDPLRIQIGGPDGMFKLLNGLRLRRDTDAISDGVKDGSKKAAKSEGNREAKEKMAPVLSGIKAVAPQFKELPGGWENGINAIPIDVRGMIPCTDKQFDVFKDHYDDCEEICGMPFTAPEERLVKAMVVMNSFAAGRLLLGYYASLIAAKGFDPMDGTNVVARREEVVALVLAKDAADIAAWQKALAKQKKDHADRLAKAAADYAKAKDEHTKKGEKQVEEQRQATQRFQAQALAAVKKVEEADKEAKEEKSTDKAEETSKMPPPQPPAPPPPLAPLPPPEPIPDPVWLPPPPPAVLPAPVQMPAIPDPLSGQMPSASSIPARQPERPAPQAAKATPDNSPAQAPQGDAAAGGGQAQQAGGGGGGGDMPGDDAAGGAAVAPKGNSPVTAPASPIAAGPAGIISQHQALDARKAEFGGKGGAGGAGGEGGEGGGAPAGESGTSTPVPTDAAPGGGGAIDPTVQKVIDSGKTEEEAQKTDLDAKKEQYHQKTEHKLHQAGATLVRMDKTTKDAHEKHRMPEPGEVPPGTPDQARVAFSNWLKLKMEGQKLPNFIEAFANKRFFNFDQKNWGDLLGELKKINDAIRPEDQMPDPKVFATKHFAGSTYLGKDYKEPGGNFDPSYSLTDEAIKALETLKKFKELYGSIKPGQWLADEAEKMDDAAKTAYVTTALQPLAGGSEPMKALREALDKLGPKGPIAEKVSPIDAGKGAAPAAEFWAEVMQMFNPSTAGLAQVSTALDKLEKKKAKDGDKDKDKAKAKGDGKDKGGDGEKAAPAGGPGAEKKDTPPVQAGTGDKKEGPSAKDGGGGGGAEKKDPAGGGPGGAAAPGAPAQAEGAGDPAAKVEEEPKMMKWPEAQGRFEGLKGQGGINAFFGQFGINPGSMGANQQALIAKRKTEVETLVKSKPGAKAEECFNEWKNKTKAVVLDHNRAVADVAQAYARQIEELRQKEPRLEPDGVTQAVAAFRNHIGSNQLIFTIGDINPGGMKPAEHCEPSVAMAPVGGADWNPMLDAGWVNSVFFNFDPATFEMAKDEKKDEEKKEEEKKKAEEEKKAEGKEKPPEVEAKEKAEKEEKKQEGEKDAEKAKQESKGEGEKEASSEKKEDKSKEGGNAPPSDWKSKVVKSVPSHLVKPDDPGHTYHLLNSGEVITTTTPARAPGVSPAAVQGAAAPRPPAPPTPPAPARPPAGAAAPPPAGAAAPRPGAGPTAGGAAAPGATPAPGGTPAPGAQPAGPPQPPPPPPLEVPTSIEIPGAAAGGEVDVPDGLDSDIEEMQGAQEFSSGLTGAPEVIADQIVKTKGGSMTNKVLTTASVAGMFEGATSLADLGQKVATTTGLPKVKITKDGEDGINITGEINPSKAWKKEAKSRLQKLKSYKEWWKTSELASGIGSVGAVPNAIRHVNWWKSKNEIYDDTRDNYRVKAFKNEYPAGQKADDKKMVLDRFKIHWDEIKARWEEDLDHKGLIKGEPDAGDDDETVMQGFNIDAKLNAAGKRAKEFIESKVEEWPFEAPPKYKKILQTDADYGIETAMKSDMLKEAATTLETEVKTHAKSKVKTATKKSLVDSIKFQEAQGKWGGFEIPKEELQDHAMYEPQGDLTPEPGTGNLEQISFGYQGYDDVQFTVQFDPATGLTHQVKGENLQFKIPGSRGKTQTPQDAPATPGTPVSQQTQFAEGERMDRTHIIADRFMGSGYKQSKNLVTASAHYNQELMNKKEQEIANKINLATEDSVDPDGVTFDMTVDIGWYSAKSAQEMADFCVGKLKPPGFFKNQNRHKQLVKFFTRNNQLLNIVKSVAYTVTGSFVNDKGENKPFNVNVLPLGADIYWGQKR